MKYKILNAPAVPNMPWQDRPAEDKSGLPLWRYNENPIVGRNPSKGVARIFNSAVAPYGDAFIGVFRGEQTNGIPYIYLGRSRDAIHWEFDEEKIPFKDEDGNDIDERDNYYYIKPSYFSTSQITISLSETGAKITFTDGSFCVADGGEA